MKKLMILVVAGLMMGIWSSCGHEEVYNPMPGYFQESQRLIMTDLDSVNRFCDKFRGYLN